MSNYVHVRHVRGWGCLPGGVEHHSASCSALPLPLFLEFFRILGDSSIDLLRGPDMVLYSMIQNSLN